MPRPEGPLKAVDDLLDAFALSLRELRERAGSPTYRELARRAHYSAATLSDAASGKKLPTLAVTVAFVRACGGDPVAWERRWRADAAEFAARRIRLRAEVLADDGESPYVGLAPFQTEDAGRFFGRETLVGHLRELLVAERFVSVFGASGVGKSSLLRAGLVPAIHQSPVALMTPGAHPIEECAVALAKVTGESAVTLREELSAGGLHLRVRQSVPDGVDLVLVIDQFEEVFTVCRDQAERGRFIDTILAAAHASTSRIRIVIGVRADFYPHCALHPGLAETLGRGHLTVGAMTSEQLQRAITQPAVDAGYTLERALLAAVIADSAGNPGVLPLVSHALLETWRRRHGTTLTLAGYQAAGGIQDALAYTAEHTYHSLTAGGQRRARELFVRLIALGDGTEDTKRRVHLDEFDPDDRPVLDRLVDARLLWRDRDTVEITHEALIRCWPRLGSWLAEDREGLRLHRQLTHAADLWESDGREPSALYRGNRLAQLDDWAGGRTLSCREKDFLDASRALHAAEQSAARRSTRRLRRLVAVLVALLVLISTAVGVAVHAQRDADDQRDQAVIEKVLSETTVLRSTNPALAMQLSLAAYHQAPGADTRSSVLTALTSPYAGTLGSPAGTATRVIMSPDGHLLVTLGIDGVVWLWDVGDHGNPRLRTRLYNNIVAATAVALSPDGHTLAVAGDEPAIQLWNIDDRGDARQLATLPHQTSLALSLSFSHDGATLAAGSTDGTLQLWRLASQPQLMRSLDVGSAVRSIDFAPAGHLLAAVVDTDAGARTELMDTDSPEQPLSALPTRAAVTSAAFLPDARTLVTGDDGGAVVLWDVTDIHAPQATTVLGGPTAAVRTVVVSPDGRTVAVGGDDAAVRLWDIADRARPVARPALGGFVGTITSLAFSADSRTLAIADKGGPVRLEGLVDSTFSIHTDDAVRTVAFSPDALTVVSTGQSGNSAEWHDLRDPLSSWSTPLRPGTGTALAFLPQQHTMITSDQNSVAALWNVADARRTADPVGLTTDAVGGANALATSADGRLLVTAAGYQVRLWNIADPGKPREITEFTGVSDPVNSVAVNRNTVAVAASDRSTALWDISSPSTPEVMAYLRGLAPGKARAVAFSPDGRTLAVSSNDNTVRLFDVTDPRLPVGIATLGGHSSFVDALAFSPDGHTLASGGNDNAARLWDVTDPHAPVEIASLTGHTGAVNALAFGPDGRTLATGSSDRSIGLWDLDVEHMAAHLCDLAWPRISRADWTRYLPGFDYRPPCPS